MWDPADAQTVASEHLDASGTRFAHVRSVVDAVRTFGLPKIERDVLEVAAWLHDVGYSSRLVQTGMHAIDGARFLSLAGAPETVVSLVAFHTGAEYEAEERGLIDKLIEFDPPDQELLDLLILADLVSDSDGARVDLEARFAGIMARYEPQHPVHRAITRSQSYLRECAERAAKVVGYPM